MPDDILTPAELAEVTGKRKASAQAAELARRGIAYAFTGRAVKVARAVVLAYELLPQQPVRGIDLSKVR